MATLREEAESLRLLLLMGLLEATEVVAWADRIIFESPAPPIEVINISLVLGRLEDQVDPASRLPELTRLLKLLPGPADLALAADRVLGILHDQPDAVHRSLEAVAKVLWIYSHEAEIDQAEREHAANFYWEYDDLAYAGSPEDLTDRIKQFLADNGSRPR